MKLNSNLVNKLLIILCKIYNFTSYLSVTYRNIILSKLEIDYLMLEKNTINSQKHYLSVIKWINDVINLKE